MDVREKVKDSELKKIVNWTEEDRDRAIDEVAPEFPRDLLKLLLDPEASERPHLWSKVIEMLKGDDIASQLDGLKSHITGEHATTRNSIANEGTATRNFMADMKRVKVPYLFEIVEAGEGEDEIEAASDTEEVIVKKRGSRARRLFNTAKACATDTVKSVQDPATYIKSKANTNIELRLLCGITLKTVVTYSSIKVDEKVAKLAMKSSKMIAMGLKVAKGWNFGADVARAFGVPLPKVPKSVTQKGKTAKNFYDDIEALDSDIKALDALAEGGMDLEQLQLFAEVLYKLELENLDDEAEKKKPEWKRRAEPYWQQKLFQAENPAVKGQVTWASAEAIGMYGGDDHKAAIKEPSREIQGMVTDADVGSNVTRVASSPANAAPVSTSDTTGQLAASLATDKLLSEMQRMLVHQAATMEANQAALLLKFDEPNVSVTQQVQVTGSQRVVRQTLPRLGTAGSQELRQVQTPQLAGDTMIHTVSRSTMI